MSQKLTILLTASILICGFARAQDSNQTTGQSIIKTNPIGLMFGSINLTYERALSQSTSFQIGGNFFNKILGIPVSGIGVNVGYRYYITNATKPSPEGFYIGPALSYNSLTESSTDVTVSTVGVGAIIGYQWVFKSRVTLDLGAGPTYIMGVGSTTTTTIASFEGFAPNLSFAVGFNF